MLSNKLKQGLGTSRYRSDYIYSEDCFKNIQKLYNLVISEDEIAKKVLEEGKVVLVNSIKSDLDLEVRHDYSVNLENIGYTDFSFLSENKFFKGCPSILLHKIYSCDSWMAYPLGVCFEAYGGELFIAEEVLFNLEKMLGEGYISFFKESSWSKVVGAYKPLVSALNSVFRDNFTLGGLCSENPWFLGIFTNDKGNVELGYIDNLGSSSEYFSWVYGDNDSIDNHMENIVHILESLPKPLQKNVQDLYWLPSRSTVTSICIRKNANNEYTLLVI